LHLMAPLDGTMDHDQARGYAKRIAQRLAATAPDRYTISSVPDKRTGRIVIDYLRNGRGTTAIGARSPRAAGIPDRGRGELAAGREWDSSCRLHDGEAAAQIARGLADPTSALPGHLAKRPVSVEAS
jgi:LigD, primase-polymerase domain